ncbi:MAG TPA: hypothetical protein VGI78_10785 [Acetobacteraceae bacterium]|jgi:hypothetical protein
MCVAGLLDAMRAKLPASVRIVWMCLEHHADNYNRKWERSLDGIVAEVHLSIETVTRAVRILESRGIARGERDGPGRKPTTWHLLRTYANGSGEPPQSAGIATNGQGISSHSQTQQSAGIPEQPQQNAGIETPAKPRHQASKTPQNAGLPTYHSPRTVPKSKKVSKNTSQEGCDAPATANASVASQDFANPRNEVWDAGIPLVQAMTGMMERSARSFLGKLLKLANDDCTRVLAVLRLAQHERPLDVGAWLMANVRPYRNPGLAVIAEEGMASVAVEGEAAMQRLLAAEAKGHG